jgi:hypothetical protein
MRGLFRYGIGLRIRAHPAVNRGASAVRLAR